MILVDTRVGSRHFLDPLKNKVNCEVRHEILNSGDFAFEGSGPDGSTYAIGIELKVIEDMLGSMRSERYAGDQMVKMGNTYDVSYLIIQGIWGPDADGNLSVPRKRNGRTVWVTLDLAAKSGKGSKCFRYSELDKHINSLEIKKNVIVLRSSSERETANQIVNRYNWWQKDWDEHNSTDPIKLQTEVTFSRVSLLRKMAAELPGIGWTRSKAVEQAFINVSHMINASVESWEAIEGIGPKTARNVWTAIRERAL